MLSITVLISTKYLGHKLVLKQNNGAITTNHVQLCDKFKPCL